MIYSIVKKSAYFLVVYWLAMFTIGYELSFYTSIFVLNLDLDLLPLARNYLLLGLMFFLIGLSSAFFALKQTSAIEKNKAPIFEFNFLPFYLILLFSGFVFFVVYSKVGYIPLFHPVPGAKYFQDKIEVYLYFRPYYTLAMNLSVASIMSLIVVNLLLNNKKERYHTIFLILLFFVLLLLTGKRGPILLPFAYIVFGLFLAGKLSTLKFFLSGLIIVIIAGILHFIFNNNNDNLALGLFNSLSNSFLIGNRELARFFTNYDDVRLYGLTYLAGLTSFIPTSLNEVKELYLYPRYLIHLEDGNPDLSGGPRGTYIGEAYANFGLLGVIIVSWLFGFLFYFIFKTILKIELFSSNLLVMGFISAFILHQFILAFFENGSSFVFHFFSKLLFVLLILYFSKKGRIV